MPATSERAELLARDALAAGRRDRTRCDSAAANAHLALGCALMRGTDLHAADRAPRTCGRASRLATRPSYWHAHAILHLAVARHRSATRRAPEAALASARAELDQLPDAGMLESSTRTADDALHQRRRHEGFLGEELSEAERRVLDRLLAGLSLSDVARELWLSSNTVKTHRRNIYRKLGATTRERVDRARRRRIRPPRPKSRRTIHPG